MSGSHHLSGTKAACFPRRDTKTLVPPSPEKKRSRFAGPAGLMSILHARAL